ncbi:HEAT repeat domain-containing protein [Halorussus sp. AFM4]|uniref:HEAT repeat domain-containing protein n=1 Tax=Halorussus sp. AFM4 TaxID=3421651 RepID=UPI003EB78BEE
MDDSTSPPSAERVRRLVEQGATDEAVAALDRLRSASVAERKEAMQSLRSSAGDLARAPAPVRTALAAFLEDPDRSVRLSAAKALVAVAEAAPEAAAPVVPPLADRLADDGEFYFVRARAAEALGYVALERPDDVASPETLADLRVGLSLDEPEVREKLAKALEHVALGDPDRLRHRAADLAEHLDDGTDLVRYHLCTALAVVGCEHPAALADARDALCARLADENPYVRGRAAEALGLLGRAPEGDLTVPRSDLAELTDDETFVAERARYAVGATDDEPRPDGAPDDVGSVAAIRETTADVADDVASPDGDACPGCGLELPEAGPPLCPRCGAPR